MLKGKKLVRDNSSECTREEIQIAKILFEYTGTRGRGVAQLDKNKRPINQYQCATIASIKTRIRISMIIRSCKTQKINNGYYWKYID
jgi:hypothetical protein